MRGMNRVILVGNLGNDVELFTSNGGSSWARFDMATGRSRRTSTGWVEDTDWHRVKVFHTQAELCHRSLVTGDKVAIEGSVSYDSWTDKEGVTRYATSIIADRVHFLTNKRAERSQAPERVERPAEVVAEAK